MGAWISKYSGLNSRGKNYRHGWVSFETQEEAEAHQGEFLPSWRDGVEFREDLDPGDEWEGS